MKIKHKIAVVLFMVIFLSSIISLVILRAALNIYNGLIYSQAAQVLNTSSVNTEEYIKEIEKLSNTISTASDIQAYVSSIQHPAAAYDKYTGLKKLTDKLNAYSYADDNILNISYIDNDGNQLSSGSYSVGYQPDFLNEIIQKADQQQGKDIIMKPAYSKNSILVVRAIRQVDKLSLKNMGTIVIKCDISQVINEYISRSGQNPPEIAVLSGDVFIYSSHDFSEAERELFTLGNASGYDIKALKGKRFFVSHNTSEYTGWIYTSIIPYESIFRKVAIMPMVVFASFLALFILSLFIGLKLSSGFTEPLEQLTQKIKQIENGDFKIDWGEMDRYKRQDEIGQLKKDFGIAVNKIDTLIKENYLKQLTLKDFQLKALQAQINPHFLYNTLDTIRWIAKLNNQRDISEIAKALGTLMRTALSSTDELVPLEEELGLLNSYITIQKIRYEDRLDFCIDMDEKLGRYLVPKLILQPLVENSIHYGLEKMLSACVIRVRIIGRTDHFTIEIIDNGPGIDPDTLLKMKKWEITPNGFGIGLKNTHDRIRLIYGEQYGLDVSNGIGEGTIVQITVPYHMEDEDVQSSFS